MSMASSTDLQLLFSNLKKIIDRHTGHQKDFGRTNLDNRLYKASFNINYNQYNDALLFNFFWSK